MENARDRLMALLTEMFQLDQADLDFGIYRVMNHKREEVGAFLRTELLPTIEQAFKTNVFSDFERTKADLKKVADSAFEAGFDPNTSPKVIELRQRLKDATDPKALEAEVCSDLVTFFARYYQGGDFVSQRRYKDDVYAIPYQGEEVKLHWANHDQYYIKSSERLSRYSFTLPKTARRVRFEVVAGSTEKDNVKAAQGNERRFVLADPAWHVDGAELVLRFAYRSVAATAQSVAEGDEAEDARDDAAAEGATRKKKAPTQSACNEATVKALRAGATGLGDWYGELFATAPTEKQAERTVIEKHLERFTKRNDFDYFIHKNLRAFLRRELDVFIKNEIFHLDDVERQGTQRVEQALAKIRVLREVAHKLIDFLGQLEEFQKTLWLKKKFVFDTSWCITLDRVPEKLWPEVLANDAQRAEWVRLFAIDKIEKSLAWAGGDGALTTEFLRENPSLVVDTALFSREFTARLLASIDNLDESTTGVLIHGENFQALNLMQARYAGKVKCIYIDPPYNTGNDGFAYKDGYQHSSWITFMENRFDLAHRLLRVRSGALLLSIDDGELGSLLSLQQQSPFTHIATVVVQSNPRGRMLGSHLAQTHEYVVMYGTSDDASVAVDIPKDARMLAEYSEEDEGGSFRWIELRIRNPAFNPENRGGQWYPLYVDPATGDVSLERDAMHAQEVWPLNSDEGESVWSWTPDKVRKEGHLLSARLVRTGAWRVFRKDYIPADGATTKAKTIWLDKGLNYENARDELTDLFGEVPFNFAKPVELAQRIVAVGSAREDLVLDYHAGSGTTAHGVLRQNTSDGGHRRFVLVESGIHFDTVLKPRILKVIHADAWKDGVPTSRKGVSAIVKVVRIESYEDALENLEPKRNADQETLLAKATPAFREKYFLQYMLRWETRGQGSLVDGAAFAHPFDRALRVSHGDDVRTVTVDLVETFNWLVGLTVTKLDRTGAVQTVTGTLPSGERALVLWRDVEAVDVDQLDAWWKASPYNASTELDVVYVNGAFGIETHRPKEAHWRAERTETVFLKRMFDAPSA